MAEQIMLYGRYNELVFMGVKHQETYLGGHHPVVTEIKAARRLLIHGKMEVAHTILWESNPWQSMQSIVIP